VKIKKPRHQSILILSESYAKGTWLPICLKNPNPREKDRTVLFNEESGCIKCGHEALAE
jgi:hypothetical protein